MESFDLTDPLVFAFYDKRLLTDEVPPSEIRNAIKSIHLKMRQIFEQIKQMSKSTEHEIIRAKAQNDQIVAKRNEMIDAGDVAVLDSQAQTIMEDLKENGQEKLVTMKQLSALLRVYGERIKALYSLLSSKEEPA